MTTYERGKQGCFGFIFLGIHTADTYIPIVTKMLKFEVFLSITAAESGSWDIANRK